MKHLLYIIILFCLIFLAGCGSKTGEPVQFTSDKDTNFVRINLSDYAPIDFRVWNETAGNEFIKAFESERFTDSYVSLAIEDFCVQISSDNSVSFYENNITNKDILENDTPDKEEKYRYPLYGSVCVPVNYDTKEFIIITASSSFIQNLELQLSKKSISLSEYFNKAYNCNFTEEDMEIYKKYGGAPWLENSYTVIGQVYNGTDTLNELNCIETDSSYIPLELIMINSIEVSH